jgi:prolipoprotein diacylglyceryltransferase
MQTLLLIPGFVQNILDGVSRNGGFYFDLFYLLAFATATVWMLLEGNRRKIQIVSWLLVLAFSRLFFIVGTKVITYQGADLMLAFSQLELVPTNQKVVLGGFIFGLIAFIIAAKAFRLPIGSLDAMAIAMPISLAIQRMGCFLVGCCFGTPTASPFGVRYSVGTLPHFHHVQTGAIAASNPLSLPVHPFQLYEAFNGLLVAFIVWRYRKHIKSSGGLFLLSIGAWATIRFFLEFFRDPVAHAMGGGLILGLKLMQWILLLTALATLYLLYRREVGGFQTKPADYSQSPKPMVVWSFLLVTVVFTWSLRNWLSGTELLAMNLMLLPAIALSAHFLFKVHTVPAYRWTMLSTLVLPLFLMSQTWEQTDKKDSLATKSFDFVNFGFSGGSLFSEAYYLTSGSGQGCGSSYSYEYFKNSYWNAGFGYGREKEVGKNHLTYGLNGSFGSFTETKIANGAATDRFLFSINPYVRYDWEWVGIGGGLHLGNLYWADAVDNESSTAVISTAAKNSPIFPQTYLRVGPERIFFVDGGLGNAFPTPFPGMRLEMAVGSGFGLPRGNKFRFGGNFYGTFVSGQFMLNKQWQANALYLWSSNSGLGYETTSQVLLGLQYRLLKD